MDADFCNTDGARRLKNKIEDVWRDRGFDVDVKLVDAGFVAAMRSARTDIRSDMINGLPRKVYEAAKRPGRSGSIQQMLRRAA